MSPSLPSRFQVAEERLDQPADIEAGEVAGDDERRPIRVAPAHVRPPEDARVERLDGLAPPPATRAYGVSAA